MTSTGTGTWTWQDPDANGHSGRVLTFEPITVSDAGIYSVTYQSGECEVEEKFEVVVNEVVTGLTNSDLLNGITIYPNPSSEIFHLKNANGREVEVYNSFNQLLIRTTATSNDFQIDLNDYKQGVYFLQIKEQDISVTRRIIKK